MEADGGSALLAHIVRRVRRTAPAYLVLALGLVISLAAWRFTEQRVGGAARRGAPRTALHGPGPGLSGRR